MTALENLLKAKDCGTVCIKFGSEIKRLKFNKAYHLIKNDGWSYCSKSEYKQYLLSNPKQEIKEELVEVKPIVKKEKIKTKDRRKQNKEH